MPAEQQKTKLSGARWASQIVILLDDDGAVLGVNKTLAGADFASIESKGGVSIHDQLHDDCDGDCRFQQLWQKAWAALANRESIEWEVEDDHLQRVLRLNLSVSPTVLGVAEDRRRKTRVLTITDITKYRREYEELVERERTLFELLESHQIAVDAGDERAIIDKDDIDSSGRRRSLAGQIIEAQEAERSRVASDLHDGIAQTLGVVKFMLEDNISALQSRYKDLDPAIFGPVIEQLRVASEEVRRISANLAPAMLHDFGLCVAIEWMCGQFRSDSEGVSVECATCVDEGDVPDIVKISIYRVIQESLNNALKHAQAGKIVVNVKAGMTGADLSVEDDGRGFSGEPSVDPAANRTGLGLRSMRERVEASGGVFEIVSDADTGTRISSSWSDEMLVLLSDESVLNGIDGDS